MAAVRPSKLTSLATGVVLSVPVLSSGQTSTWVDNAGVVGSHNWTDATNWDTNPAIPDAAGDIAQFDDPMGTASGTITGATGPNVLNIGTPITLDSIIWNDVNGDGVGSLSNADNTSSSIMRLQGSQIDLGVAGGGAALDLQGSAFNGMAAPAPGVTDVYIAEIRNDINFIAPTSINVEQAAFPDGRNRGNIQLTGVVTGSDPLSKTGAGHLDFEGTIDNPFSGKFTVETGNARLIMPNGVLALSSPEIRLEGGVLNHVGSGASSSEQILDTAVISFANNGTRGTWHLNGSEETIANWGGGDTSDRLDFGANNKAVSVVNFGADNGDSSFAGNIRRDGILNKSGTGTWTLTGSDSTGPDIDFNVTDGGFQMNAIHDENVGTYTIDGDMTGTGIIRGGTVIVNSGGTLNAGTEAGVSNLTDCLHDINEPATTITTDVVETFEIRAVTLQTGSLLTLDINTSSDIDPGVAALGTGHLHPAVTAVGLGSYTQTDGDNEYDQFASAGGFYTFNAGATINVNPLAFAPVRGMVYDFFDSDLVIVDNGFNEGSRFRSGSQSAFFDLKLPDLTTFSSSQSLRWDTSLFISHGILVIVPEPSRALLLLGGLLAVLARRRR